jgi:hypothetical protein
VVFREVGIATLEPARFPAARLVRQEELAAQRHHVAGSRPEEPLVEPPAVDRDGTGPHDMRDTQLVEAIAPDLAERQRGCPAVRVEAIVLPERIDHRELRQQHQLGHVARRVLAKRGPCGCQGSRFVRQLTDRDAHGRLEARRYQTRTRAEGGRYSRWPGRISNAAYHASRLRTVLARVSSSGVKFVRRR